MSHPFCRFVVSLVLAPWLVLSATLAPEHLHESDGDRPRALAHRHVQPHELTALHRDGAEIDHADGRIVWLDSVGACQAVYELPTPSLGCVTRFDVESAAASWIATSVNDAGPAHGPPRLAQSLRAPPASAL